MKKIVLSLIIVLSLSASVMAEEKEPPWQERCDNVAEFAKVIMSARQAGVPMSKQMKTMEGVDLYERMVIEAYEAPAFQNVPKITESITSEFRDKWYLTCVKVIRKK